MKLYMLIGVPGSGKSTWINSNKSKDTVVLSTDNYIEKIAQLNDTTYSDIFKQEIKNASVDLKRQLTNAIKQKKDIIWDQTNVSKKSRKSKLLSIPDKYIKIAVYFETPSEDELNRRLNNRPGKHIPLDVVKSMSTNLELPDQSEGFDQLIRVRN